jgi:hypothetical protein
MGHFDKLQQGGSFSLKGEAGLGTQFKNTKYTETKQQQGLSLSLRVVDECHGSRSAEKKDCAKGSV